MPPRDQQFYVFGPFRLDIGDRTLYRGDAPVPLTPKAIEVLLYLASNAGRVVEKDELIRAIWADTFVEESNLGQQIFQIRRALSQDSGGPSYIETVPKRGYRLKAVLERAAPARRRPQRRLLAILSPAIAIGLVAVAAWIWRNPQRQQHSGGLELKPLTSYPGAELFPALSPNGEQIAFTWTGPAGRQIDLYTRAVNGEPPLRLTNDPEVECYPSWSPDGSLIAFLHCAGAMGTIHTGTGVFVVASSGSPKRQVAQISLRTDVSGGSLAWMPDGRHLIVRHRPTVQDTAALYSLDIDTGEMQRLTSPPPPYNDALPAPSADGHTLAFVRTTAASRGEVFLQELSAGAASKELTHQGNRIDALAWLSSRELIYLAEDGAIRSLWGLRIRDARPRRLASASRLGLHFSLSRDGRRLVYSDAYQNVDIVRAPLTVRSSVEPAETQPIVSSTQWDGSPQYAPNGAKIAFASDRSGRYEIWTANADGSNPAQLTFWNRYTGSPRWSPDGAEIAADSQEGKHTDIYVAGVNSHRTRKVTAGDASNFIPSWSRDGKWIYFVSDRSGRFEIWKAMAHPPDGAEHAWQLTHEGGFGGFESADGKRFYYAKRGEPYTLWTVPAAGGREWPVNCTLASWMYMAVFADGFYYSPALAPHELWFYNFAKSKPRRLLTFGEGLGSGISVSPDRKWLLFAPGRVLEGDLYLADLD
jgi:Tol biopolymer transport system component/DNA-binding winged helix-turn-helix (wHTH) protein